MNGIEGSIERSIDCQRSGLLREKMTVVDVIEYLTLGQVLASFFPVTDET